MAAKVKLTFTQTVHLTVADGKPKPPPYLQGKTYEFEEASAAYWQGRGVAVLATEGAKAKAAGGEGGTGGGEGGGAGEGDELKLEDMTVKQLSDFSEAHKIDLGKATKKGDIVQVIRNFQTAQAAAAGGGS